MQNKINASEFVGYDGELTVEVGGQSVIVDKLFGPLVMQNVRVRVDVEEAEWVFERWQCNPVDADGNDTGGKWVEVARVNGQGDVETNGVECEHKAKP